MKKYIGFKEVEYYNQFTVAPKVLHFNNYFRSKMSRVDVTDFAVLFIQVNQPADETERPCKYSIFYFHHYIKPMT